MLSFSISLLLIFNIVPYNYLFFTAITRCYLFAARVRQHRRLDIPQSQDQS